MRGTKSCRDRGKAEEKAKPVRQGKTQAGTKKCPSQQDVRQQSKEWDHVT